MAPPLDGARQKNVTSTEFFFLNRKPCALYYTYTYPSQRVLAHPGSELVRTAALLNLNRAPGLDNPLSTDMIPPQTTPPQPRLWIDDLTGSPDSSLSTDTAPSPPLQMIIYYRVRQTAAPPDRESLPWKAYIFLGISAGTVRY